MLSFITLSSLLVSAAMAAPVKRDDHKIQPIHHTTEYNYEYDYQTKHYKPAPTHKAPDYKYDPEWYQTYDAHVQPYPTHVPEYKPHDEYYTPEHKPVEHDYTPEWHEGYYNGYDGKYDEHEYQYNYHPSPTHEWKPKYTPYHEEPPKYLCHLPPKEAPWYGEYHKWAYGYYPDEIVTEVEKPKTTLVLPEPETTLVASSSIVATTTTPDAPEATEQVTDPALDPAPEQQEQVTDPALDPLAAQANSDPNAVPNGASSLIPTGSPLVVTLVTATAWFLL